MGEMGDNSLKTLLIWVIGVVVVLLVLATVIRFWFF
jgi:hypothetical protein